MLMLLTADPLADLSCFASVGTAIAVVSFGFHDQMRVIY